LTKTPTIGVAGGAFHHDYGNGVGGKDDVESHQLLRGRRQPCAVEVAETISNLDVLPVAQIAHPSRSCFR
jgi:hypothetical protein